MGGVRRGASLKVTSGEIVTRRAVKRGGRKRPHFPVVSNRSILR